MKCPDPYPITPRLEIIAYMTSAPQLFTSLRAPLIGLFLSIIIGVWTQHMAHQQGTINLAQPQLPLALLIPFIVLILAPNLALKSRLPGYALAPNELLLIFAMGLIASTVPDWAMPGG